MGMTITEKILARKSGQAKVSPGDLVTVGVDTVVFVDTMFVPTRWRKINRLDHPERVIVVLDHRAPTPDRQGAATHQIARAFVEQFGIKRFHDIGYDQGGPCLRAAGIAFSMQRFTHRQRGRIQLPRARRGRTRRGICRDDGRDVVHCRRNHTL